MFKMLCLCYVCYSCVAPSLRGIQKHVAQQIVRAQTQTGPNIMNAAMQQQRQSQPSSWFDGFSLQGLFPRPSHSFSNVENDVLMNPYAALRDDRNVMMGGRDIRGGIPINVSTQGTPDSQYRQIGILTRQNGGEMICLDGRPLMANRDKWQFYTMNNNNIKLPIVNRGKSCTNEYGCDNLYNGDSVYVEVLRTHSTLQYTIMLLHLHSILTWLTVITVFIWTIN